MIMMPSLPRQNLEKNGNDHHGYKVKQLKFKISILASLSQFRVFLRNNTPPNIWKKNASAWTSKCFNIENVGNFIYF
jgi:hypothetical protein